MSINKTWHEAHRMPKNATLEERIEWHLEHATKCGCGPIPPKLLAEIEKRKGNSSTRCVVEYPCRRDDAGLCDV